MIEGILIGAAIYAGGFLMGRFLPARRKGPKPAEPPQPLCGCKDGNGGHHHHSYHDPKTGECHGQVYVGYWSSQYHYDPCTCRQYTGPQPLPEFYAPEIPS